MMEDLAYEKFGYQGFNCIFCDSGINVQQIPKNYEHYFINCNVSQSKPKLTMSRHDTIIISALRTIIFLNPRSCELFASILRLLQFKNLKMQRAKIL